jgi:O-antigen/teichoic acid export membrane protein
MISRVRRYITAVRSADARTKRMIFVAGASYLGRFGQGIAVLITLPIARQSLSPDLFGVWMMLSSLLAFMSFADLGVGNGVLNQITKSQANNDTQLLRRTLVSGYAITGAAGATLFLAWLCWYKFSPEPTALAGSIKVEDRAEVLRALYAFALILAVNIPASLIFRVQLGAQQGYLNGWNQLTSALLTIMLVPLCLHLGGNVAELVMATIGVQVLVNTLNTVVWLNHQGMFRNCNWARSLDIATVGLLLRTGSMFFILQLAAVFSFQSDAIVITQTLGQSAYGDFAVVQKLFLFASMFLSSAMLGLWPAFGDAIASQNMYWARKALVLSSTAAACASIVLVSALAVAMPWLMEQWMNNSVTPAFGLVAVLAVWTIIETVGNVFAAFLNGANILRPQLLLAICMALAAFGLKWVLTPALGATGAVLSTILAYCMISIPGCIYIFKRAYIFKAKN